MSNAIAAHQKQIRELSERYLTASFREKEAHSVSRPTGQNKPENFSTNLPVPVLAETETQQTATSATIARDGLIIGLHPKSDVVSQARESTTEKPLTDLQGSGSRGGQFPSTLEELSEALRYPLPKPEPGPRCYSALEACKSYKPLTLEMVSDLLAKKRAARDAIIAEYIKRTGQQVDYCDECDMGVTEEEHEEGWQTVVTPTECEACDGLGVVAI